MYMKPEQWNSVRKTCIITICLPIIILAIIPLGIYSIIEENRREREFSQWLRSKRVVSKANPV